jgi:hypothetical protein
VGSCFAALCQGKPWSYLRSAGCHRQSGGLRDVDRRVDVPVRPRPALVALPGADVQRLGAVLDPEDTFWAATLAALGQRLGVPDPKVETRSTCVDSRRQWRHSRNVWHNSGVRSLLQTLATPARRTKSPNKEHGMNSQPHG